MSNEGFQNTVEASQESELPFEVRQHREGVTLYIFKNLAVAIDVTGKNYKALPELSFGPFNNETNSGSLNQPEEPREGVDMRYVSKCVERVAAESGIHQFWLYPFGDDVPEENKERRERARMRLFERTWSNIKPAPEGYGYILTI